MAERSNSPQWVFSSPFADHPLPSRGPCQWVLQTRTAAVLTAGEPFCHMLSNKRPRWAIRTLPRTRGLSAWPRPLFTAPGWAWLPACRGGRWWNLSTLATAEAASGCVGRAVWPVACQRTQRAPLIMKMAPPHWLCPPPDPVIQRGRSTAAVRRGIACPWRRSATPPPAPAEPPPPGPRRSPAAPARG